MKIFRKKDNWYDDKVNFVDENNVFVGYDLGQSCCEQADWFISNKKESSIPNDLLQPTELAGFNFDVSFFVRAVPKICEHGFNDFDEGGMVIFKISNGDSDKYLHIFNSHNGYYAHGFECPSHPEKGGSL